MPHPDPTPRLYLMEDRGMHVGREIHRTATHVLIDQEGEADVLQIPLRKIAAVFRRTAPGPTDWVLEERWPGGEP